MQNEGHSPKTCAEDQYDICAIPNTHKPSLKVLYYKQQHTM